MQSFSRGWSFLTQAWGMAFKDKDLIKPSIYALRVGLIVSVLGIVPVVGAYLIFGDTGIGQIITYDDPTDSGEVPRFVTRVEPNADGTNVGIWTPSTGSDDYAVLASPIDASTYTENTSPSPGDRVEVLTNAGGDDLSDALGTTPSVIDSVAVHSMSSGQSINARAVVGDGTSETTGSTVAISAADPTYAVAVANTKPSGGNWGGSDQPTAVYDVVST